MKENKKILKLLWYILYKNNENLFFQLGEKYCKQKSSVRKTNEFLANCFYQIVLFVKKSTFYFI